MDREKFLQERKWIRDQLTGVADFWLKNGMDSVHGGIYTCLDRTGKVFSTDKSVWMQVQGIASMLLIELVYG